MTVMEFSQKYGIDCAIVYQVAETIDSLTTGYRGRQYDEAALKLAVIEHMQQKYSRARKRMEKALEVLEKMGCRLRR